MLQTMVHTIINTILHAKHTKRHTHTVYYYNTYTMYVMYVFKENVIEFSLIISLNDKIVIFLK